MYVYASKYLGTDEIRKLMFSTSALSCKTSIYRFMHPIQFVIFWTDDGRHVEVTIPEDKINYHHKTTANEDHIPLNPLGVPKLRYALRVHHKHLHTPFSYTRFQLIPATFPFSFLILCNQLLCVTSLIS